MEISLLGSAYRLELDGRKEAAGRARECAEALRSPDRLDRLLASLGTAAADAANRARMILKILCAKPALSSILERLPLLTEGSARLVLDKVAAKDEAQAIEAAADLLASDRPDLRGMAAVFLAGKGKEGTFRIARAALRPEIEEAAAERIVAAAGGRGIADWVFDQAPGWYARFNGGQAVEVVGFLERAIGSALRDLEGAPPEARRRIQETIDGAFRVLRQATRHRDVGTRIRALSALAAFDAPGWRKEARALLGSCDPTARRRTLELLEKLGAKEFFPNVVPLIGAPGSIERELALRVAESLAPDHGAILDVIRSLLGSSDQLQRLGGAVWLGRRGGPKEFPLACRALEDEAPSVVLEALDAACALAPSKERLLAQLRRKLDDARTAVRRRAVALLGKHGAAEDWARLDEKARRDAGIEDAVIEVLARRDPPTALALARILLRRSGGPLLDRVWDILEKGLPGEELARIALDSLASARDHHGAILLDKLAAALPGRLRDLLAAVLRSKSGHAKCKAIDLVLAEDRDAAPRFLEALLESPAGADDGGAVRQAAFEKLLEAVPAGPRSCASPTSRTSTPGSRGSPSRCSRRRRIPRSSSGSSPWPARTTPASGSGLSRPWPGSTIPAS